MSPYSPVILEHNFRYICQTLVKINTHSDLTAPNTQVLVGFSQKNRPICYKKDLNINIDPFLLAGIIKNKDRYEILNQKQYKLVYDSKPAKIAAVLSTGVAKIHTD